MFYGTFVLCFGASRQLQYHDLSIGPGCFGCCKGCCASSRSSKETSQQRAMISQCLACIHHLGSLRSKPLPHWPDSGWVSIATSEKTVPKFTVATLINYFVLREVHHDKTAASDFSSVSDKAYRLYFKGHVQKLEVNSVAQETFPCKPSKRMFYVRAKVHPEMKQKKLRCASGSDC